jgi:chromosome segregation ATPase
MELNREQIIKAYEHCDTTTNCKGCPYEHNHKGGVTKCPINTDVRFLLKELTEDNERLRAEVSVKRKLLDKAEVRIACVEEENNQLKADICNAHMNLEHITEDNEAQYQTINNLLKTIEDVQGVKSEYETFIGGMKSQIDKIKAEVTADTVRKMQERLKSLLKTDYINGTREHALSVIDQIEKEMLEDNNNDQMCF